MHSKLHFPLFLALTLLLASVIVPFSFREVMAQTSINWQSKKYYGKYYGISINVGVLEDVKNKYPDFDPIDFIWYYLRELRTRYGMDFRYLKFSFDFWNGTSISDLCSLIENYVGHFATYYDYKILVQLGALRHTSQKFDDTFLNALYGNIAVVLNSYSDKIVAFIGENELEGNTTCPICGKIHGYSAFNGNVSDMIAYAKKLHDTWHKYSNIPFTHSAVAPWNANSTHVYEAFWFKGMDKSTYKTYLDESQDILCWNSWYYDSGTQYLQTLANELNKQVIIAEHSNFDPEVLRQIIDGFGDKLITVCLYEFARYDKQILFDWACPEHYGEGYTKHSLFAMVKIPVDDAPEGYYFGIASAWNDLDQKHVKWYDKFANGSCFANRSLNLQSNGIETFSVWVNFQAVVDENAYYPYNYVAFARFCISSDKYFSLGALVYYNQTFRFCFEWLNSTGQAYWYLSSSYNITCFNQWYHLKLIHNQTEITCQINNQTVFTANNGVNQGSIFKEVRFGEWSSKIAITLYVDDIQLWFDDNLVFRETFENPMDDWVKWIYPLHAPIYIDRGKFGWIDYICVYQAQNLLYGYYSLQSFQFSENRIWVKTEQPISLHYSFDWNIPSGAVITNPTFKIAFAFPYDVSHNIQGSKWKITVEIKDSTGTLGIFSTQISIWDELYAIELYIEDFVLASANYKVNLYLQLVWAYYPLGIGYEYDEVWIKQSFSGILCHFGVNYEIKKFIPSRPKNKILFTFNDEDGNPISKYVCGYYWNETRQLYEPLNPWEIVDTSTYVAYLENGTYKLRFTASGYKDLIKTITINNTATFSFTFENVKFYYGGGLSRFIRLRSKILTFVCYVNGSLDIDNYGFIHVVSDSGKLGYVRVDMHYRTGFPALIIEAENISIVKINVPRVYWAYAGEDYDDLIEESGLIGIAIDSNDTVTVELYTLYKPSKVYKGENEFENWQFKNGILTLNLASGDPTFSINFSPITYYAEKTEQTAFEWIKALLILVLVLAGIGIMRRLAE